MNPNGIFNPQNRFWMFMEKVMDLCVISLLWFLCSIPVFTIGASTTALFQYTTKLTKDEEGYVLKSFFKAFRQNFLQATVLWAGILLAGGFLVTDLYLCQFLALPASAKWVLRILLVSFLIVYLLTMIYIFPLLAYYKVSLKKAVSHAFVMSMGNLHISVTILVIYGLFGVITWFMPVLFMVWFVLASYIASYLYRWVFDKYLETEEENEEIFVE